MSVIVLYPKGKKDFLCFRIHSFWTILQSIREQLEQGWDLPSWYLVLAASLFQNHFAFFSCPFGLLLKEEIREKMSGWLIRNLQSSKPTIILLLIINELEKLSYFNSFLFTAVPEDWHRGWECSQGSGVVGGVVSGSYEEVEGEQEPSPGWLEVAGQDEFGWDHLSFPVLSIRCL